MKMPVAITTRSLHRSISRPHSGLDTSRINANAEITAPTWRLPTPKLRANTGSTGTSTPKPTATQKAIRPSTYTSRGSELRARTQLRTLPTGTVCPTRAQ